MVSKNPVRTSEQNDTREAACEKKSLSINGISDGERKSHARRFAPIENIDFREEK
jgi:hypothetical protein